MRKIWHCSVLRRGDVGDVAVAVSVNVGIIVASQGGQGTVVIDDIAPRADIARDDEGSCYGDGPVHLNGSTIGKLQE